MSGNASAILRRILNDGNNDDFFDSMKAFGKKVFSASADTSSTYLVVSMARKSSSLTNVFLPILHEDGAVTDIADIVNDKLLGIWFNAHPSIERKKIKIALVDDTYLSGRAIDECIRRLVTCYGVEPENITLYIYAMLDNKANRDRLSPDKSDPKCFKYLVNDSDGNIFEINQQQVRVCWGGDEDTFKAHEETLFSYSMKFVECIHACGMPYVAYMPSFKMSFKAAQNFVAIPPEKIERYIQQNDIHGMFKNAKEFDFFNITTHQMLKWDIEAFMVTPRSSDSQVYFDWMPTYDDALSIMSLRFYFNRNDKTVLMIPYISLKTCKADGEFPENATPCKVISSLLSEKPSDSWPINEGRVAGQRLLSYATAYLWGKQFLAEKGVTDVVQPVPSSQAIPSKDFVDWIDSDYTGTAQEWKGMWSSLFSTERISPNVSIEDESDQKIFNEAFAEVFVEGRKPAPSDKELPSNPYTESLMLFRILLEKERARRVNNPKPFQGVPVELYIKKLGELLGFSKSMIVATISYICDIGAAVTYVHQRGKNIGTYLVNGEQSYHAFYHSCPSYANFLKHLTDGLCNRTIDIQDLKGIEEKIKSHFESRIADKYTFNLTVYQLLYPLRKLSADIAQEQKIFPYYSRERSDLRDSSVNFFDELIVEYNLCT